MNSRADQLAAFDRLLTIMDELREKCPWDKKQTLQSLRHLTIEETYELSDAILKGDKNEIKKEIGDILLHLVFYSLFISSLHHHSGKSLQINCFQWQVDLCAFYDL